MKTTSVATALALSVTLVLGGALFVSAEESEVAPCVEHPLAPERTIVEDEGEPGEAPVEDPDRPFVLDQWLVGLHNMPLTMSGEWHGAKVLQVIDDMALLIVQVDNPATFLAQAQLDANTRYVEWDDPCAYKLDYTPNDTYYTHSGHYGVKTTKINLAWDTTRGTTAVKVATIDSGLRKTHQDITGSRVLQGYDFRFGDTDPNDTSVCSYHGTHTTGTAGATINNAKGIAGVSQHSVLPVKIFGSTGCSTTTTAIVNALRYAGDQGAHVSSNSWGGGSFSTAINDAITYSHNKGTNHVGAAGNSGPCTNCVGEPWRSAGDRAIVVSCITSSNAFCSFSSQGPQVDVTAPGSGILSLYGGSDTQYTTMSGTSMSTPHVAGVAALVEARFPGASFSTVQSKIKNSADSLGMIADRQGAGRLDGQGAIA